MAALRFLLALGLVLAVAPAASPAAERLAADTPAVRMARPTDGADDIGGNGYAPGAPVLNWCPANAGMCFHWVTDAADDDAPALVDSDADGVPNSVEDVAAVFRQVRSYTVGTLGFRAPRPDAGGGTQGPNASLDIYIADLAGEQYGYCAADDPTLDAGESRLRPVHCVVDDNYSSDDYCPCPPNVTGLAALKVTAAHEFFHAVQCAYDCFQPTWMREGTAVWMEDQIPEAASTPGPSFDGINQHYWYLADSQLVRPDLPLTAFGDDDDGVDFEYGAWLFWRHASERWGTSIIRDIWARVAANPATLAAVAAEINQRDTAVVTGGAALRRALNRFAAGTYFYEDAYAEGGALSDPVISPHSVTATSYHQHLRDRTSLPLRPPAASVTVSAAAPATGSKVITGLRPLSHRYVAIGRGRGVARDARLRIAVRLPASTPTEAMVVVRRGPNRNTFLRVPVSGAGTGSLTLDFGRTVQRLVLVFSNAGTSASATVRYSATLLR